MQSSITFMKQKEQHHHNVIYVNPYLFANSVIDQKFQLTERSEFIRGGVQCDGTLTISIRKGAIGSDVEIFAPQTYTCDRTSYTIFTFPASTTKALVAGNYCYDTFN